jgi:hypothetical protein
MQSTAAPLARIASVAMSRPILLMVAKVYVPVLFPLTFLIALSGLAVDRALGWGPFLPAPGNFALAAVSLVLGLAVVGVSYAELVVRGEGSSSAPAFMPIAETPRSTASSSACSRSASR